MRQETVLQVLHEARDAYERAYPGNGQGRPLDGYDAGYAAGYAGGALDALAALRGELARHPGSDAFAEEMACWEEEDAVG